MKNVTTLSLVLLLSSYCNPTIEARQRKTSYAANSAAISADSLENKQVVRNDTTPRVTGIGGIFFLSKNPKALREWYGKHLGLAIDPYGSPFEFRNANRPEEINYLEWSPHSEKSQYFKPSTKDFMINYRVYNLEALVRQLRQNGVTIVDTIQSVDYGKFVHIMDTDGNKLELWEPVDSVLTKLGGATTK